MSQRKQFMTGTRQADLIVLKILEQNDKWLTSGDVTDLLVESVRFDMNANYLVFAILLKLNEDGLLDTWNNNPHNDLFVLQEFRINDKGRECLSRDE